MDDSIKKFESEMRETYEDIDKSCLRRLSWKTFTCSAKCCENTTVSSAAVHRCLEDCKAPTDEATNYIQSEFNDIQSKLQRCVMVCNDDVKNKMENTTSQFQEKHKQLFENCAIQCIDKHIVLLPSLNFRIKTKLEEAYNI